MPATVISVGIVGPGLIGGTLLDQIQAEKPRLLQQRGIDIRVVAIAASKKQLFCPEGLAVGADWKAEWDKAASPSGLEEFEQFMVGCTNGIVVDCTASPVPSERYAAWLGKGLHVVTPNKKAGSGPLGFYRECKAAEGNGGHWMYETTVGAGLPIIDTLKGLLDTGDKVHKIEGILSGTLSYIFNTFDGTAGFSEVVKGARAQVTPPFKDTFPPPPLPPLPRNPTSQSYCLFFSPKGFTEPDPRDDLNGLDVARKVTILARECGLEVELSDVNVESLVAPELASLKTTEEVRCFAAERSRACPHMPELVHPVS